MDKEENLKKLFSELLNKDLKRIIISRPLVKMETDGECVSKINVRPVLIRNKLQFQETVFRGNKVLHDNFYAEEMARRLLEYVNGNFGQLESECMTGQVLILTNKKGTVTIKDKRRGSTESVDIKEHERMLSHNKEKHYILADGEKVDFLISLGIQTADGRVVKSKFDKFKQINRYLEFVDDVASNFPKDKIIRIVDFGCGKSYLTFALYYYLKIKKAYNVDIIGLDLKADVIKTCNELKKRLGYDGLRFLCGDIKDYEDTEDIDMVVSLHACDTATDYALYKAISWNAKVIFAVPCCHHEVARQLKNSDMKSTLKYGIIKERMASLITDAYRGARLEELGYDTQILEFIDMEHTPKNILIRAVRNDIRHMGVKAACDSTEHMEAYYNIMPTFGRLTKTDRTGV